MWKIKCEWGGEWWWARFRSGSCKMMRILWIRIRNTGINTTQWILKSAVMLRTMSTLWRNKTPDSDNFHQRSRFIPKRNLRLVHKMCSKSFFIAMGYQILKNLLLRWINFSSWNRSYWTHKWWAYLCRQNGKNSCSTVLTVSKGKNMTAVSCTEHISQHFRSIKTIFLSTFLYNDDENQKQRK